MADFKAAWGAASLMAGQVDLGPISAVVAQPLIKSGKLKAYAVIGTKRFAGLPQLKTMAELGYKSLDIDFWHMLLAPAGTPRPIIDKLNAALRVALADPKVRKTYAEGGMDEYRADRKRPRPRVHCSRARSSPGATWSAPTTSRLSKLVISNSAIRCSSGLGVKSSFY